MSTKFKIINEATNLMLEKGYESVSMNDIATNVGIAKPTIYHYYKTKEQLFLEVIQLFFKEGSKWVEAFKDNNTSFRDALLSLFTQMNRTMKYLDQLSNDNKLKRMGYYFLLFDAFKNLDNIKEQYESSYIKDFEIIKNAIQKAIRKKEIREDINWYDFSMAVSSMLEGTMFLSSVCPNLDFKNIETRLFNFVWNNIKYIKSNDKKRKRNSNRG